MHNFVFQNKTLYIWKMMTDYDVSRHSTVNRRYRHDLTIGYHCQNLPPTFLHQIPNKDLQHVSDPTNCELKELFQESVCVLCFVCQHNLESIQHHFKHIIDKTLSRRLLLCTTDSGISGQNANVELLETENVELGQGLNANLLRKIHSVLEGSKLYDDSGSPVEVKRTLSERSELLPTYASRCEPPSSPRSYHEGINDHLYEPLIHSETVKTLEPQLNIATGRFVEATTLKPNKNGIQILDTLCLPKGNINWAASWQNQQNDCAPSEDSGQHGHPPSLISLHCAHKENLGPWAHSYPLSAHRRLWSDWADAQADLSLRWAHMSLCLFCHKVDQFA